MALNNEQRFSIVSTTIFLALLFVTLLFFGFKTPFPPPAEEGILINFGNSPVGQGQVEPKPSPQQQIPTPAEPVPQQISNNQPDKTEDILDQDFDQTAVIEKKKKEDKKIKDEELKKQREEQIEKERLEQIEKQRQIDEAKERERIRQEEVQKALTERAKNAFGGKNTAGNNTGQGQGGGQGNQGQPDGSINSENNTGGSAGGNGISFSLNGRTGKIMPVPAYTTQVEGKVVVEITVDQNGNVVSARPGVKGTTTTNKQLNDEARKAAMQTKFNVDQNAPALQTGTITYVFVLQ